MRNNRRGSFMMQALLIVAVIALVSSLLLKLAYGRRVTAHRANESQAGRQRLLGVESYLNACLEGTGFGQSHCSLPAGCPPAELDGRQVRATASGTAPNCALNISVDTD